ncbi:MAG: beta-galactosidase [Armatimonadia bacterium]
MPAVMMALMLVVTLLAGAPALALEGRVVVRQGVPTLLVDGRPVPPMMLFHTAGGGATPLVCKVTPEWQQFSYTFRAPVDDDNVGCHLRNIMPVGDWFVDDVRLVEGTLEKPASANLLKGGDFEGEEPPNDWNYFLNNSTGAAVEWALVPDNPKQGQKCLRVRITSPGTISYQIHMYQRFAIQKGKTYTFSAWLRSDEPREVEINSLHQGPPWTVYGGGMGKSDELLKLGAERGLHIGNPPLPVVWTEPGKEPDFTILDEMVTHIVSVDPQALIIPRLNLDAPQWWKQAHPDHIQVYDGGTKVMASPASELWRADAAAALRQTVRHLEESFGNNMLGYHPCAQSAGEWFYDHTWEKIMPCFEEPFRAAFAQWAKAKYGTVEALRAAWRQPDVTFETIRVPTLEERVEGKLGAFRDPVEQRFCIDFSEYMQVCLADDLLQMARVVKEETQGKKLTVFFYGYHHELSGFTYGPHVTGHFRLHQVLHSPDVDCLVSPISYGDRQAGGQGSFMSPADSIQLHGKLWINEDDTRTHLSPADSGYGRTSNMVETLGVYRRNFGHQFERRCGTWWMDFGTGWMADTTIFDNFARERDIWQQMPARGEFRPQVAIINDEDSNFYLRNSNEITAFTVSEMRRQFNRIGCTVGLYLLDDVLEGKLPSSVKMYVFTNAFRLTDEQRRQLREQFEQAGKMTVWLYAPGFVKETAGVANVSELLGFKVEELPGGSTKIAVLERLPGVPGGHVFGDDRNPTPRLHVPTQEGVTALGHYEGTQQVALASKQSSLGTTVFCGGLLPSPEVLRGLAREAGVHIYCDSNDVISACRGFISIHATAAGQKTLHFRRSVKLKDLVDEQQSPRGGKEIGIMMDKGETRMFAVAGETEEGGR